MTFWKQALKNKSGPAYQQLSDAIHDAISNGTLTPGARLPPQRELSFQIGVSIGTVTRAYDLATRRGDVQAIVGKGTFVAESNNDGPTNLRINLPADIGQGVELANALSRRNADEFLSYIPFGGSEDDRAAGRAYLKLGGLHSFKGDLILTAGGQHALTTALLATTKPGDLILCDPFSFGGFLDFAKATDRRVMPIQSDINGIKPATFEKLCADHKPAAAFLMPTAQNPTGTTLPLNRRKAIAKSAAAHNVMIIEDGLYDPFANEPLPPLATFAPDHTLYIGSLSKTLVPGLRVGYLTCPPAMRDSLNELQHLLGMGPPQAMANIATELMQTGATARLVKEQRIEILWRQRLADKILGTKKSESSIVAPHYWLTLPANWTSEAFAAAAEEEGILVSPSEHFAVERPSAHVRLALGAAPNRTVLQSTLEKLAKLTEQPPTRMRRSV
jgi:DNA-binding transcriptional MocR family regulator